MAYRLSVSIINNWAGLTILLLAAFLPVYGPPMAYIEGAVLPVTSKLTVLDVAPGGDGVTFRFTYNKYRACEYLGIQWIIKGTALDAHPLLPGTSTRSPGAQVSKMWTVAAPSLEGSEVWFWHRCGPFWVTATKVFG